MSDGYNKEEQTCCLCLPLATGMKVLGYVVMIDAVLWLVQIIYGFAQAAELGGIFIGLYLVPFYIAFLWFKWLRDDTEPNTKKLVTGMKVLLIYAIIVGLIFTISMILFSGLMTALMCGGPGACTEDDVNNFLTGAILTLVAQYLFTCFINWYFYRVTKRYYDVRHVHVV